jgi:hypothetical protein
MFSAIFCSLFSWIKSSGKLMIFPTFTCMSYLFWIVDYPHLGTLIVKL